MLRPFVDGKHLEADGHGQGFFEDLGHFGVARGPRVQGPVARAVLKDDEREERPLRDVVVAPLAHWNSLVQIVAAEEGLAQLSDIAIALQWDAKLLADGAGTAVAPNEVRRANGFLRGVFRLEDSGR